MIGYIGKLVFKVALKRALAYAAAGTIAAAGAGAVQVAVHKATAEIDKKNRNDVKDATEERRKKTTEYSLSLLQNTTS